MCQNLSSTLYIQNGNRVVQCLLITSLIILLAVFCISQPLPAALPPFFSLLLSIENIICSRGTAVACSALYPNIHTVYSLHAPIQACSHLYAPSLRGSASVDSAERWPSQLPEVELPPIPREFTKQYPCVCGVSVCVWCIFMTSFSFNGNAIHCSETVKLDPQ